MNDNAEDILSDENATERFASGQVKSKQHQLAARIVQAMQQVNQKHLNREDKERLWDRIQKQSVKYKGTEGTISLWLKCGVAASLVLGCSLAIWWYFSSTRQLNDKWIHTARTFHEKLHNLDSLGLASDGKPVVRLENEALLHFRDSSLMVVDANGMQQDIVINGSGEYNTLAVPYGKRTEAILPDSTKIWLNAGSYLTFSKKFMEGNREVFLQGEAFFNVKHLDNKPFYVYVDDMQIKVLGTSFNVSSYKDDTESSAVLVEGAIELTPLGKARFKSRVLSESSTATFNKINGELKLETINMQDRIAWTQKRLVLKSTPLPDLIKKLERVYNAEIRYETGSEDVDDRFSGIIDLQQPLEDVLHVIYEPFLYHIQQEGRRFVIEEK